MRFYWHDGQTPQGPMEVAELLRQPGFTSESIVCPVGAERPEDWKPAVNYEPLRDALFKPKPFLITPPKPVQPPCPSCRYLNADDALFCNHCGRPMKGAAVPGPKPPEALPAAPAAREPVQPAPAGPALPQAPTPSLPGPAPAENSVPAADFPAAQPFNPSPDMFKPPEVSAGPKRGPAGKMGQLGRLQEAQAASSPAPKPVSAPVVPEEPAPAAPKKNRTIFLAAAAFTGAFLILVSVYFWRQSSHAKAPSKPVKLSAPPAMETPARQTGVPVSPAAEEPPAAQKASPPPLARAPKPSAKPAASKVPPAPAVRKSVRPAPAEFPIPQAPRPERKPPRRRKEAPPPLPKELAPEPAPADPAPGEPSAPPSQAEPGPASAPPQEAGGLSLPGLPKKVRKVDQLAPSQPPDSAAQAQAPSSEQLMIDSAKEQFSFCHQLMKQGAFGDFFDTCLCVGAKNAKPYKGDRRAFIEKRSQDPAAAIGSDFEVSGARLSGQTVSITAKWSRAEGAVERTEKWVIEDGLWCLAK